MWLSLSLTHRDTLRLWFDGSFMELLLKSLYTNLEKTVHLCTLCEYFSTWKFFPIAIERLASCKKHTRVLWTDQHKFCIVFAVHVCTSEQRHNFHKITSSLLCAANESEIPTENNNNNINKRRRIHWIHNIQFLFNKMKQDGKIKFNSSCGLDRMEKQMHAYIRICHRTKHTKKKRIAVGTV